MSETDKCNQKKKSARNGNNMVLGMLIGAGLGMTLGTALGNMPLGLIF